MSRLTTFFAAVLALTGCQSPSGNDGGADAQADGGACPNSEPLAETPLLFAPCTKDADCPTGGTCLTNASGYPGGFCTKPCTLSDDCRPVLDGQLGVCVSDGSGGKRCMRECLNGFDCGRPGYTCVPLTGSLNICRPSCTAASCGECSRCNEYTGMCQPQATAYPPAGGGIGETCTESGTMSTCKSKQCITDRSASTGNYNGWNRGSCIAPCALPEGWSSAAFFNGDVFPRGNCPTGAICFPDGETAQNDPGICMKECALDSECRVEDGYFCRRTWTRGSRNYTWTNGVCWPIDCLNSTRRCPTNYYCETQRRTSGSQTVTFGVCRPGTAPMGDAGVDGSVQDSATDVTDVPVSDVQPSDVQSSDVVDVVAPSDASSMDSAQD